MKRKKQTPQAQSRRRTEEPQGESAEMKQKQPIPPASPLADLDYAYELQLEEALTDSLLHPHLPVDPETLDLLFTLERDHLDAEKSDSAMREARSDLKRRIHDRKLAEELSRVPEEEWRRRGDEIERPVEGEELEEMEEAEPFRLYFKGLFSEEMVGGIGAAVCDFWGNEVVSVEKGLVGDWRGGWEREELQLKVDLKALVEGLNAALCLGVRKIDCYIDFYPLYQYLTENWLIKQQKIATIVDQVYLLQRRFTSCRLYYVGRKDVLFAFKLARGAIDSQVTRTATSSETRILKETCSICLDDIDVGQIFSIDDCKHRYCISCMKQHVEVKLLNGVVPGCPHEDCTTKLTIPSCRKFLSPELIDKMNQRIIEASIPVTEKIYCPHATCSVLMSKAEALPSRGNILRGVDRSARGQCVKCRRLFCINCKVPWHHNLNCDEYKRQNPNSSTEDAKLKSLANTKSWRQCIKCNHMIELNEGCYHITCRCGYEFCYTCGAEWRNKQATCQCPIWDETNIVQRRNRRRRLN